MIIKKGYILKGIENESQIFFPYREEINCDDPKFPIHIESIGITKPNPKYEVIRNCCSIFTIEYIVSGKGYLNYNGKNYKLSEGDLYILSHKSDQHYGADSKYPYEKVWLNFRSDVFEDLIKMFHLEDRNVFHFPKGKEYLDKIFALKEKYYYVEDSSYECLKILIDMLFDLKKNVESENDKIPSYLRKCIDYIDINSPKAISINELVKISQVSQVHLINEFKKYYNDTPYSYQLKARLKLAKIYIINSDKSLGEIAKICNFCDAFSLSKSFKNVYGQSPRDFKKMSKRNFDVTEQNN